MPDLKKDIVFWTGIMRDHAMFHANAFTARETNYIKTAMYYRSYFQNAMKKIEGSNDIDKEMQSDILDVLESFIEYKKCILRGLLICNMQMNFPPTLVSHQISEAKEFKKLLMMPEQAVIDTPLEMVSLLKIWLADGSVHAAGLMSFLDPSETLISAEADIFKGKLDKLFIKASELEMMLKRVELHDGALLLLADETVGLLEEFNGFLDGFIELRTQCKVLGNGTLSPIIPDHFIREHTYYISKIKAYVRTVKAMHE